MFFSNKTFDLNKDISNLGYKELFKLYLENKSIEEKVYLFKQISNVKNINKEDVYEIIKYCSIYNRSYLQIKSSNDNSLFNSDYLNNMKIIIDIFIEHINKLDQENSYITDLNSEYDYFDLVIFYLKEIKDYNELYHSVYAIFDIVIINDLKLFYKIIYHLITNSYFNSLKAQIIYEIFHLKDILFAFLRKNNSNIEHIINDINKLFVHIPTVSSPNLDKLTELVNIRSICSDKSLTFLNDGYAMLSFYNKNNIFDYSAVSLQFFKVIEIEIKEKIIIPCSKDLNKENLFNGLAELVNLNKFNYDFLEKLELGKLRYILRNVKSIMYELREEVPVSFINEDIEKFYTRLIALFMNVKTINFYLDILNYKVIELYRNSAVHTGILSYQRASEAVEITKVFLLNLKELNYSFKLSNSINLKQYDTPIFLKEIIKENS